TTTSTGTTPELTTTTSFFTSELPTTSALPEGFRFDILFLIGVSKESKDRLDDMNRFVTSVMSAYDVSQRNARVALVAVGSDEVGSTPIAKFDTIYSYRSLLQYIDRIKRNTDFKHDGQAAEEAFSIAVLKSFHEFWISNLSQEPCDRLRYSHYKIRR
ncbi:hypothetical protein OSTOST_17660, partial [Ostertagia ostertagi]